jgi:hypothetical protein
MYVLDRKYTYRPPLPVADIALLLYMYGFHTSQEVHLETSKPCYRDSFMFTVPLNCVRVSQFMLFPADGDAVWLLPHL